jgi:hypothetical protein
MGHIERRHPDMQGEDHRILETVSQPDYVQQGDAGTLIAVRHYARTPLTEKYCAVVYREVEPEDGFVVTAYLTRQPAGRREIVWRS